MMHKLPLVVTLSALLVGSACTDFLQLPPLSSQNDLPGVGFDDPATDGGSIPPAPDSGDAPTVAITEPTTGSSLSGAANLTAIASDDKGVVGIQFLIDGSPFGAELTSPPYTVELDTTSLTNGPHSAQARARDTDDNLATSEAVAFNVDNQGCKTVSASTNAWESIPFDSQSGSFTAQWSVIPQGASIDGAVALASGAQSSWSGLAAIIRFNAQGTIDVRDGDNYTALKTLHYDANQLYQVRAEVDVVTHTYSVFVKTPGASEHVLAQDVAFRSPQQQVTALNTRVVGMDVGAVSLCGFSLVPAGTPPPPPSGNDTTPPTVSISSPLEGATLSGSFAVSAAASDDVGVVGVQFYLDGTPAGAEDASAPFRTTLDASTMTLGSHTLSAIARDAAGNTAASPTVSVTVSSGGVSSGGKLFASTPSSGSVTVGLHAGNSVSASAPTLIAFGLPLPRGLVSNISELKVTDASDSEIACHIQELARWHSLSGDTSIDSVRSALIWVERTLAANQSTTIKVHYGTSRTMELGAQGSVTGTWVSMQDEQDPGEYPAGENIEEPAVYATLPPDYLSSVILYTRTTPEGALSGWSWYDTAYENYGNGSVDPSRINYTSGYEPWLYDRARSLFNLYIRTGDVGWLRHAHRATQFYKNHTQSGAFDLKGNDLKYNYGQSMVVDYFLTGDASLLAPVEKVAALAANWPDTYSTSLGFWTERNHAYSLLGTLSAWELTGDATYASRINTMIDGIFEHQANPPSGWLADGSLLHTAKQHDASEFDNKSAISASPWMTAIMADAVFRYYLHSEDARALQFFSRLGEYITNYAVSSDGVPYYFASSTYTQSNSGDEQHAPDVLGMLARAAWANTVLGNSNAAVAQTAAALRDQAEQAAFGTSCTTGSSPCTTSPAREWSWWFATTSDMAFLLDAAGI